jgi:hypothetical protein
VLKKGFVFILKSVCIADSGAYLFAFYHFAYSQWLKLLTFFNVLILSGNFLFSTSFQQQVLITRYVNLCPSKLFEVSGVIVEFLCV